MIFYPFSLLRFNNFQCETDHNQNYVTKCAVQSDDENTYPKYSDVISNNGQAKGSFKMKLIYFLKWFFIFK